MLKEKQNELGTNKQELIDIGPESSTFQEKQGRSKTDQRANVWREEQKKQELKVHGALSPQQRTVFVRGKGTDPQWRTWRMITVFLGTACIIVIIKVSFLLPNLFPRGEKQSKETPLLDSLCHENADRSCHPCSRDWIAFGNNFYRVFREIKTWPDSQSACEELNSHLVEINSKAELENLLLFEINGWIHLKTDEFNGSWLWESGTKTQQTLINGSEKKYQSCYFLRGRQIVLTGCSSKRSYTCEFNIR
ncbi:killer cell lectin-like receptor subfamily I member 2 [Psammomys obesus]|uniref:killer cell lectin-like receptor subfamily I member 2 n=1 Tax=Psammomys obesus TaxID=48139 RepID=UPI00245299DA|nr:killer cell lectin-like receptor subfamily I member 2 [Psammomys obesus]